MVKKLKVMIVFRLMTPKEASISLQSKMLAKKTQALIHVKLSTISVKLNAQLKFK
jgi:hypothetical protein